MSTDTQRPVISRTPAAASPEAGVHTIKAGSVHMNWSVNNSFYSAAEDKQQAQARELYIGMTGAALGGRRSCGAGDDSPVSVIHANFNMQLSHPSSASTSMEHPLSSPGPPPAAPEPQHPAPPSTSSLHLLQRRRSRPHHIIPHLQDAADSDYAGLLSERVQQAFSKSQELLTFKSTTELNHNTGVEVKPPWPNYMSYKKELEWLNLQEDPQMSNGVSKTMCVHSHKFGGSPDHVEEDDDGQCSEDQGFSIYTSNSTSRDQDEDSVIDFFPTANRTSSSVQLRRRSYDRMNEVGRIMNIGRINYHENPWGKRVSSLSCNRRQRTIQHSSRSCGLGHDDGKYNHEEVEEDAGCCTLRGRLSSSKWDDAARWLTSPAPAASRGRSGYSNDHLHLLLPKAARQQLVQAPAPPADSKSSDPPAAQGLKERKPRLRRGRAYNVPRQMRSYENWR